MKINETLQSFSSFHHKQNEIDFSSKHSHMPTYVDPRDGLGMWGTKFQLE